MILKLADCSTTLLKGMDEDVLIKVEEFIFLIDFVVLEIEVVMNPKN